MFRHLPTSYVDVDPQTLRWSVDLPPATALATLPLRRGGLRVELRILGASHQVLVTGGESTDLRPWTETIACDVPGDPLPDHVRRQRGDADSPSTYLLTCTVRQLSSGEFERMVTELVDDLRDQPHSLVGAFPGDQWAITALTLDTAAEASADDPPTPSDSPDDGGVAWRSWHSYPRTGHLVTTHTLLQPGHVPHPGGGGAG